MNSRNVLAALLLSVPPVATAGDPDNGRELYLFGDSDVPQACTACHDDAYFRDSSNKSAESMSELKGWVQGCNQTFPQGWFPEEEDDVAAYLNKEFYGFSGR